MILEIEGRSIVKERDGEIKKKITKVEEMAKKFAAFEAEGVKKSGVMIIKLENKHVGKESVRKRKKVFEVSTSHDNISNKVPVADKKLSLMKNSQKKTVSGVQTKREEKGSLKGIRKNYGGLVIKGVRGRKEFNNLEKKMEFWRNWGLGIGKKVLWGADSTVPEPSIGQEDGGDNDS